MLTMLRISVREIQPGDRIQGHVIEDVTPSVKQWPNEPARVYVRWKSGRVARWNPGTTVTVEREA